MIGPKNQSKGRTYKSSNHTHNKVQILGLITCYTFRLFSHPSWPCNMPSSLPTTMLLACTPNRQVWDIPLFWMSLWPLPFLIRQTLNHSSKHSRNMTHFWENSLSSLRCSYWTMLDIGCNHVHFYTPTLSSGVLFLQKKIHMFTNLQALKPVYLSLLLSRYWTHNRQTIHRD